MPEIGSSDNDRNVDCADIQSQVEFSGHGQNDPPIFPPLYQTDRLYRTIHHKASCWQPWDNLHRAGIMGGWEVDANLFIGVLATNRDSCCLWASANIRVVFYAMNEICRTEENLHPAQLLPHTLITPQPWWNDGSLAQSGGDSGTERREWSARALGTGQSDRAESKLRKWDERRRCGVNSPTEMWLWLWKWDITVRVWQVVKCVTVTRIKWCDTLHVVSSWSDQAYSDSHEIFFIRYFSLSVTLQK